MSTITFLCGNCRGEATVPESAAGQAAECPYCQAVVAVPVPPRPKAVPLNPTVIEPPEPIPPPPIPPRVPPRRRGVEGRDDTPPEEPAEPRRRAKRYTFECLGCRKLIHMSTAGADVECPYCEEVTPFREVKAESKKRSASLRRMRDRGETSDTMRTQRFLWYALAVLASVGLIATGVVATVPDSFGLGVGGIVLVVLSYIVLSFLCMGADNQYGDTQPLSVGHIVVFFLFFGLLFLSIYTLVRVTRYPQLGLALVNMVATIVGVCWVNGRHERRQWDNPPAVVPFHQPDPFPAHRPPVELPALPAYTPPGIVPRADDFPGVVTYWPFDEGAGGTAGDTHSRAVGTLTGSQWVPGIRGHALEFDGKADWMDFSQETPISFGADAPFTVSCWVKPQSRNGPVFSFRGPKHPTIDTATILGVWVENGKLCSWARKDGSIFFPNEQFSPDELVPDVWHHVAVTRQPDGTVDMYQDGVLASRKASRDSNGSFTLKFGTLGWERYPHHRVGGRDELVTKFLAGAIDEFAAFDRALTDREIARLAGR